MLMFEPRALLWPHEMLCHCVTPQLTAFALKFLLGAGVFCRVSSFLFVLGCLEVLSALVINHEILF